ncbi:MAG: hypothetical protein WA160_12885 [Pseudobdellovibrio sp.]
MDLYRLFIPSWRFFDQLGIISTLYYRIKQNGTYSSWFVALEKPNRAFLNLFLNSDGNIYLFSQVLVDRLAAEVSTISSSSDVRIEALNNFKLIENLVRQKIQKEKLSNEIFFQFKIQVHSDKNENPEDFIISKELRL